MAESVLATGSMKMFTLAKQFVVSDSPDLLPPDWETFHQDRWWIGTPRDQGIPVVPMYTADAVQIGWLVGYVIDGSGEFIDQKCAVPVQATAASIMEDVEQYLYTLAGRWAAVVLTARGSRFHVDPAASLAAVYCPEQHVVCSTVSLIPRRQSTRDHEELARLLDIPAKDGWYTFGLTPRADVHRVLPNHYLDLSTWKTVRHWPAGQPAFVSPDQIGAQVERIASRIERTISAVVRHGPTTMSLTAGHDTRVLLACARDVRHKIEFGTLRIPDPKAELDCDIAERIARRHRLNHEIYEWIEASEEDIQEWLYRTGSCAVAGRTMRGVRCGRHPSAQVISINGVMGELGRPYYWRSSDREDARLSARDLVERINLPASDLVVRECEKWLAGIPCDNAFTILDFLYLEQQLGCWGGPQLYGHVQDLVIIWPFNHRDIVDAMVHLPVEYRRRRRLVPDLVRSRWPELNRHPINRYPGLRGFLPRVARKLRQVVRRR
jgi:hypothetical protein